MEENGEIGWGCVYMRKSMKIERITMNNMHIFLAFILQFLNSPYALRKTGVRRWRMSA